MVGLRAQGDEQGGKKDKGGVDHGPESIPLLGGLAARVGASSVPVQLKGSLPMRRHCQGAMWWTALPCCAGTEGEGIRERSPSCSPWHSRVILQT